MQDSRTRLTCTKFLHKKAIISPSFSYRTLGAFLHLIPQIQESIGKTILYLSLCDVQSQFYKSRKEYISILDNQYKHEKERIGY